MSIIGICRMFGATIVLAAAAASSPAAPAPADGQLASEVRDVFSAKCAQCHSETLAKPRGDFGYVLNLHRLASDHDLVVPFDASRSKLWRQIESGKMPPKSGKGGPMSDPEKALVRWWIELGAPADAAPSAKTATSGASVSPGPGIGVPLLAWLGRFHVLVIHFPIALLVAAAIAESWWMWKGRFGMSPAVRYCVLLGAAGALVAAALGWIRAPFSGYGGGADLLLLHRWVGTAAGVCALVTAIAFEYDVTKQLRTRVSRAALFASAILVGVAGHLGGSLVYGTNYFKW